MQEVLNEPLYNRLQEIFGDVKISNSGMEADVNISRNFMFDIRNPTGPQFKVEVRYWGETYCVCCPRCGDTRHRLCFSHLWGTKFEETNCRLFGPFMAHHNDADCNWADLKDIIAGRKEGEFPAELPSVKRAAIRRRGQIMGLPSNDPNNIVPLISLPNDHPAVIYVINRGFDIKHVVDNWGLCYCVKSEWNVPIYAKYDRSGTPTCYRTPANRLIIPNLLPDGRWLGWQARWLGAEVPIDPMTNKKLIPKYLTAPGLQKSATVFNVERAVQFTRGKLAIVSEGPLSTIATGMAGCCTMGMFPSPMQEMILYNHFNSGAIVFMVEDEAKRDRTIFRKAQEMRPNYADGVFTLLLPVGEDAASMHLDGDYISSLIFYAKQNNLTQLEVPSVQPT